MLSVQVAAALSTHLFDTIGPAGTAWLRLTIGAIVFIVIRRPRVRSLSRSDAGTVFALGVSTGLVTVAFSSAIDRIPLGTAVAIEFLGPLGVAVFHDLNPRRLVWPALALVGVVLLTQPWHGAIDPVGVLFAVLAGCGWGTYIVLTQRVGDRLAGLRGTVAHDPDRGVDGRDRRCTAGGGAPQLDDRRGGGRIGRPDAGPADVTRAPCAPPPHDRRVRDLDGARTGARPGRG